VTLDAPDDRTAVALARHLIGEPPTAAEIARWRDAIAARGAALEASPVHTRRFLPREIGALGWLALGARMVRAGFRSALGVVLVRGAAARWP